MGTFARIRAWSPSQQLCEEHNLPPAPGLAGRILRQRLRASLAGSRPRVLLSNEYGEGPLVISAASVAPSLGMDRVDPSRARPLRFGGASALRLEAGQRAWSDPVDLKVDDLMDIAVSLSIEACPRAVTSHPGSRTSSYIARGADLDAPSLPGAERVEHWYYLAGLDLEAGGARGALVAVGDSLTDGRGTTTDGDTRWTDVLMRRLRAGGLEGIAVLNAGLGGNRVLEEGLGPACRDRFARDVLEPEGARWIVLFEGVNDIGTLSKERGPERLARELLAAYEAMAEEARGKGLWIAGCTITPFGGSQYDFPEAHRARALVNEAIRAGGIFNACIDFDAAIRDPAKPEALRPEFDSGDHLHLSNPGYEALAQAFDLGIFS